MSSQEVKSIIYCWNYGLYDIETQVSHV